MLYLVLWVRIQSDPEHFCLFRMRIRKNHSGSETGSNIFYLKIFVIFANFTIKQSSTSFMTYRNYFFRNSKNAFKVLLQSHDANLNLIITFLSQLQRSIRIRSKSCRIHNTAVNIFLCSQSCRGGKVHNVQKNRECQFSDIYHHFHVGSALVSIPCWPERSLSIRSVLSGWLDQSSLINALQSSSHSEIASYICLLTCTLCSPSTYFQLTNFKRLVFLWIGLLILAFFMSLLRT